MKRLHIAIASMVLLGILVLVTVAHGIGGVAAAEDDRFRIKGTTLTKYLGTDTLSVSRIQFQALAMRRFQEMKHSQVSKFPVL